MMWRSAEAVTADQAAQEEVDAEVSLAGPVQPSDGRFSDFAQRLRDAAASGLRSTRRFWTRVEIEDIRLDGESSDPDLVILLRTRKRPEALYALRAKVSEYAPEENDPESWAGYIHDEVMEAVDADARGCLNRLVPLPGWTCSPGRNVRRSALAGLSR